MTRFFLVRHASYDRLGSVLAGWTPGVHLSLMGLLESRHVAERIAPYSVDAIYTSPLERCRETAALIGDRLGKPVHVSQALGEIRFGDWTGRTLAELEPLPEFQAFLQRRSRVRIPGGESMAEVQVRAALELRVIHETHPIGNVVVVSHGDVLKAVIAETIGLSLDDIERFQLDPASITTVERTRWGARLTRLNDTEGLPGAVRRPMRPAQKDAVA